MSSKGRILVVDDSIYILTTLKQLLKRKVEFIEGVKNPEFLMDILSRAHYDLLIIDMNFKAGINSGNEGLFWLRKVKKEFPELPVIMITAYGNIELAVESMKEGAADFITKPWNPDELLNKVEQNLRKNQKKNIVSGDREINNKTGIIGCSGRIKELKELIGQVGPTDANILITGENGTGKNLVAQEIHLLSARNKGSFISIDLGALNENLFESELFGYNKGAYTGANKDKTGKLELADHGTLFLDEIANISLGQQQKLLRVLQEKKLSRLGSNREIWTDFRLICSTNTDIPELIRKGEFREDLYYRIKTIEVNIPPLRERESDIIILANYFAGIFSKRYKRPFKKLEESSKKTILEYSWPGNVRELEHEIEKAVILSNSPNLSVKIDRGQKGNPKIDLTNLAEIEKFTIQKVIDKNNGNLTMSARELGISRSTLYLKIEKYGIQ